MGEGMPPLKLPYNASENPYMAAQQFLYKHELDQVHMGHLRRMVPLVQAHCQASLIISKRAVL